MADKKYYPVDSYYSFKEDKLYYIVKQVDEDGKVTKIAKSNSKPKIKMKIAPYTEHVQYLIPIENTKEIEMPYKQYYMVKKQLEKLYDLKKVRKSSLQDQYPDILTLKTEIYDDYKAETQFLQQEIFSYDDDYINSIQMAFWDIEVLHDDTGFPHADEAKFPINAIAKLNKWNNTVDFYCILDPVRHQGDPNILMEEINKKFIENFPTIDSFSILLFGKEEELIIQFLQDIKQIDVLIGWNSITFDTLYMYTRCQKLGLSRYFTLSFGQMFKTLNVVESKQGMVVDTYYTTKILSFDYIMLIKFFSVKNYPSVSLDYMAQEVLKDDDGGLNAKVKVPNLNKEYFTDLPNFALYNVNDVILNDRIDGKLQFVTLLFKMKMMTRGFTASLMSINNILDSYIALKAQENGLACVSKIKAGTYYKNKIWYIYRRVNHLTNERLKVINEIREDNKGFSIFVAADELINEDTGIVEETYDNEVPANIRLTKTQIPFAWNDDKYPGAYVKVPRKGIYLNVVDFDATSMYPTSIYTTNNSIDTWIYQVPENVALKYIYERPSLIEYIENNPFKMEVYDVRENEFKSFDGAETLALFDTMFEKELVLTESGAVFIPAHIKEGFFRKLIAEPISNRQATKREMKILQKENALTADHPDMINLNVTQLVFKIVANCFSPDTEVITIDGIKNIKDIRVGDFVYNQNPETNMLEIDEVIDTQEFDYDDDMYKFKNIQNVDQLVTDHHRFRVYDRNGNKSWEHAEDIYVNHGYSVPKMDGINIDFDDDDDIEICMYEYVKRCSGDYGFNYDLFIKSDKHLTTFKSTLSVDLRNKIDKYGKYNGNNKNYILPVKVVNERDIYELNDKCSEFYVYRHFNGGGKATKLPLFMNKSHLAKLVGWYVANGSLYIRRYDDDSIMFMRTEITKCDDSFKKKIIDICNLLKIQTSKCDNTVYIINDILFTYFEIECGKGSYNKCIPQWILKTNTTNKTLFFDSYYECDGNKNIRRCNTVSQTLRNDLILLLTSLGYYTKSTQDKIVYQIVWFDKNIKLDGRIIKEKVKYKGKVHCVTTKKNKCVIAGRNKKFMLIGQSVYGYLGYRKSRLFNIILATTITINCQFMIRYVAYNCREIIAEVQTKQLKSE